MNHRSHTFSVSFYAVFASALVLIVALAWFAYPGAMTDDSFAFLRLARSGKYVDSIPPLMPFLYHLLLKIVDDAGIIMIFNLVLFYGGLAAIMVGFARTLRWATLPIFVVVAIFPPIVGIITAIWTDVLMAGSLISAVGLIAIRRSLGPVQWLSWPLALLLLFVAIGARHNAIAAAAPLVGWGCYEFFKQHGLGRSAIKIGACSASVLLSLFMANQLLAKFLDVEKKHFWTVLAAYDISAVIVATHDTDAATIFAPATYDDLKVLYSARSVMPLLMGKQVHVSEVSPPLATPIPSERLISTRDERARLARLWLRSVSSHPMVYLTHRWSVFSSLIGRPPWRQLWAPVMMTHIYSNNLGIPERAENAPAIFWRPTAPWVFLCFELALLLVAILTLRRNSLMVLIVAFAMSGILHMSGLFVVVMSGDFRYSHWMIVTCVIGWSLYVGWVLRIGLKSWSRLLVNRLCLSK